MTDLAFKPGAACQGEYCFCGEPAAKKVGEEIQFDDPMPRRHNLTRYVCAAHYALIMGPAGAKQVGEQASQLSDIVGERDALAEIGRQIAWWLRYTREYGRVTITSDTHIIPPCWPSYGQLCNWLDHLNPELAPEARAALSPHNQEDR